MLGTVITVTGSQMTVRLESDHLEEKAMRIGAMVKAHGSDRVVVGSIAEVQMEAGGSRRHVLVVDLVGELLPEGEPPRFSRGVSHHPVPGAKVSMVNDGDLRSIFAKRSSSNIRIGSLYDDESQPAFVQLDELLGKHFAVLGASGSGKSCTVALILTAILANHPNAHVLMLDPHNEYATAFGDQAEVLNVENLKLPFWLLDSEEAVRVLVRGGTPPERESQAMILRDSITRARRHFAGEALGAAPITVDTPVPYRISDLIRFINDAMGKLDKADTSLPFLRLRTRLESLKGDKRFAFMFAEG